MRNPNKVLYANTFATLKILQELEKYFPVESLQIRVRQPLEVLEMLKDYDIKVSVNGGGTTGQADAIKLAISKALVNYDLKFRVALKKEGLLTRDSRVVERKKYGRRKARRSFQFSKR